jgi:hypothetical protein
VKRAGLTIHDVARGLGVVLPDDVAVRLGQLWARDWVRLARVAPVKALRRKKCGSGKHCLAVYPKKWRPEMEASILVELQGNLFPVQGELFPP